MKRHIFYTLQFVTGFFNAATVIPLLFVVPAMLYSWCFAKERRKTRIRARLDAIYLAGIVSGIVVLGLVVFAQRA